MNKVAVVMLALVALGLSVQSKPVNVTLYAESLCPYCIHLLAHYVSTAVNEIGDIFTLTFVPWGNAKQTSLHTFECQHGHLECVMNTVEACVLHYYPQRDQWFPFMECVDKSNEVNLATGEKCATKSNFDWDKVLTCANGDLGHKLEEMYAAETASLNPPHEWVPWVTINGKHAKEAEGKQFMEEVCKAYTGTKPKACSSTLGRSMADW